MNGAWNVLWICDFRGEFIQFESQFEIHICIIHAFQCDSCGRLMDARSFISTSDLQPSFKPFFNMIFCRIRKHITHKICCDFDRASSLICGNKMPTRRNRGFYCRSYCLLNMFRAPLCPSSGAEEYYTVVAACGISYFVLGGETGRTDGRTDVTNLIAFFSLFCESY